MSIDQYQLDDDFRQDFSVSDPTTGGAVDADADPDVEIYEDGGTSPIVTGTASKRDAGTTGQYTFGTTLTAAAGFEVGKTYNVWAKATVGGTEGKRVVGTFKVDVQIVYVN